MTPSEISRLSRIDAVYGLAALTLLGVGLTLWLSGVSKPSIYYTQNWIFILKISLFGTIGLLSVYPTIFFLKNRGSKEEKIKIPSSIFWMLRFELLILFIIPLLAGLMARGVGFIN